MSTSVTTVSIVVPCLNEVETLPRCLDSILSSDFDLDGIEVLVVDGYSDDGTRDLIDGYCRLHPSVRLVDNPRRTQQHALNIGILASSGDCVIRLDAHATIARDYVRRCVELLNATEASVVGGVVITCSRSETLVARSITCVMSSRFGVGNSSFRVPETHAVRRWVETVPYGCYRREVYEKIGLYDERLEASEDADFHSRLVGMGLQILLDPAIKSYYYARGDLSSLWRHSVRNGKWLVTPFKYTNALVVGIKHFVPAAFVGTMMVSALLSTSITLATIMFLGVISAYLLLSIIFSIAIAVRKSTPLLAPIMVVAFGILHLGYGVGTLIATPAVVKARILAVSSGLRTDRRIPNRRPR